ncbi:hypothetical protein CRYUN_Cryun40dG0008800 [Craigia yunnanensis]
MEAKWLVLLIMAIMLALANGQESVKSLFENLFAKRNTPGAHAVGFWDYHSFITAAAQYQPHGFGTTGGKLQSMKEVAALLGHVGSKTSCGYGVATGGPLAWGLCYKEMRPRQIELQLWRNWIGSEGGLVEPPRILGKQCNLGFPGCNLEVDDPSQEASAFSPRRFRW